MLPTEAFRSQRLKAEPKGQFLRQFLESELKRLAARKDHIRSWLCQNSKTPFKTPSNTLETRMMCGALSLDNPEKCRNSGPACIAKLLLAPQQKQLPWTRFLHHRPNLLCTEVQHLLDGPRREPGSDGEENLRNVAIRRHGDYRPAACGAVDGHLWSGC